MTRLVWDVRALLDALDGGTRPQALWDAALAVLPEAATVDEVVVLDAPAGAVLWDAETLGAPRALAPGSDVAALLREVAAADPHTWAGVVDGRYAAGTLGSYLVARATRGLEHVALRTDGTDGTGGTEGTDLPVGVHADVLPERVAPGAVGRADPACVGGLDVPLLLLAHR